MILTDDEGQGGDEDETEAEFDMLAIGAELYQRGGDGQGALRALLTHSNPEVRLGAATSCLQREFEVARAEETLRALSKTQEGRRWPAFYASKALWRRGERT